MKEQNYNYVYNYDIYVYEKSQEILAVVEISHYQGNTYLETTKKICRNLEWLRLTPELFYYELTNGFPSYPPFDSKDFGGYTYNEVLDHLETSEESFDRWIIAEYEVGDDYGDIRFYYDFMNEKTRTLFDETMQIIVEKSEFPKKKTNRKGIMW